MSLNPQAQVPTAQLPEALALHAVAGAEVLDELDRERKAVERDHVCDCETCRRSNSLCPASAGTVIDELAQRRIENRKLREQIAGVTFTQAEAANIVAVLDECQNELINYDGNDNIVKLRAAGAARLVAGRMNQGGEHE